MLRRLLPEKHPVVILILISVLTTLTSSAQYFGRNKVLYQDFDFLISRSSHFDIYNYLQKADVKRNFVQNTERWYLMHQRVLRDTFKENNPLILYNNHAHFQQTRAIEGTIDVGTGGVTEGLKNRVVMPIMESNAQTDHVLGHEMVHAFQYHLVKDSLSLNALNNLPLWMVEGLAEYMSIGYVDANTAMWMRSALANDKLPTLKDLTNRPDLYFPYRWGEAFWAYVTAQYGDTVIRRLFMETAKRGYNDALKYLFKMDEKEFSTRWQNAIRSHFSAFREGTSTTPSGTMLLGEQQGGRLNIVPSISPDGRLVAYWSEKNLFSLDLYLADATTGQIVKKVTTNSFNSHIDQYSSFESSVAWSPDSRQLAFVAFAKGRNQLLIADASGKIQQQLDISGVPAFSNPTWSPDGRTIVVTGLVEGQSDLYAYNVETKAVKQLTNDHYSDLLPSFSPDGKWIAFSTDRLSLGNAAFRHIYSHNISLYNVETGAVSNLDVFPGANNMNPVFGQTSDEIYFVSDRDGFRNLYSYNRTTTALNQLTNLFTGISGITSFSPAISISRQTNELVYTYYNNSLYTVYRVKADALTETPVNATAVNMQAATLPPLQRTGTDIVQNNLSNPPELSVAQASFKDLPYKSNFQLDYLGNTGGIGVQAGGAYGTGMAGGVNGIFSDMLGNHQLFGALSLNGEIYDLAGQFAYLNQKSRVNWGLSVSHIPYVSGAEYLFRDSISYNGDNIPVINYSIDLLRTYQDQFSAFAAYPFSTIRRLEAGASFARYYYRLDRYSDYYDETGTYYLGNTREKMPTPSGFNFSQGYLAFVGDNSFFGVASPLAGHRFRFEAGQYLGVVNLQNLMGDYRKYFRFQPLTLATRNLYVGRFGRDAASGVLPPLFIGYPTLVRGYNALQYAEEGQQSVTINDLVGSQIYVANVELRLPLTGPERLSAISSRFLFSELNLFTDAGTAWGDNESITGEVRKRQTGSKLIMSSGVSLRVNLFGYLVIEPFYAIPWQNGGFSNGTFGFNFVPGW